MEEYKNYLDNGNLPKPYFVKVDEKIDLLDETLERIAEILNQNRSKRPRLDGMEKIFGACLHIYENWCIFVAQLTKHKPEHKF